LKVLDLTVVMVYSDSSSEIAEAIPLLHTLVELVMKFFVVSSTGNPLRFNLEPEVSLKGKVGWDKAVAQFLSLEKDLLLPIKDHKVNVLVPLLSHEVSIEHNVLLTSWEAGSLQLSNVKLSLIRETRVLQLNPVSVGLSLELPLRIDAMALL
jgi:hypothetical protein